MTGTRGNGPPKGAPGVVVPKAPNSATRGIPAWAGPGRLNKYDNLTGVYNAKASNLRRTRLALSKAASRTGKLNIITMGDSALIGYNGSVARDRFALPRQIAMNLGIMSGAPVDGGTSVPPVAASTLNDRWVLTGTFFTLYPFLMLGNAATATYESELAGDSIEFYYTDNSANFSYSIDGATAVNVVPTAGPDVKKITVTGLSDTTHTIKFTAAGNYSYICAVSVLKTYAISNHNLAYGGSRVGVSATLGWTTGSAGTSLKVARELLRTATGFPDPDLIIIGLGGNDMSNGDDALATIAGLRTMRNWYPNADCILISGVYFGGSPAGNLAQFAAARYALADELDCVYVDFRDALKDAAYVLAQGGVGPDNAHPIDGLTSEQARIIAQVISGSGAVGPQGLPPTIHYKTVAAPVISSAMIEQFIRCNSASAQALTVPTNATDPIPIGSTFEFQQYGAGLVTITAAGGVTIRSAAGLKMNGQYAVAGLRKIGTDEWVAYGDLTT